MTTESRKSRCIIAATLRAKSGMHSAFYIYEPWMYMNDNDVFPDAVIDRIMANEDERGFYDDSKWIKKL